MKYKITAKIFVIGFLLIGIFFPSFGFAGIFSDDEKNWDFLFKTLKKINLRLSNLESKEVKTIKQAQGQIYSQLEEIQRLLPSLQGIMEVNKSEIDKRISNLLTKTEEIQTLSVNQEQHLKSDFESMKTKLELVLQTVNNSLEDQKTGIVNEFDLIKKGIATDIKSLSDSNTQNFKNFSDAEAESFRKIVENISITNDNISNTNKTIKENLIPAIIQENKNILSQIIAKIGQNKEETYQQNEKLVKILESTLTIQQTNQNQLVENLKKVNGNVTLYGEGFNNLQATIKNLADGAQKNADSLNASITRLQEISNQNSNVIKTNELTLKTVTEKIDNSSEAIKLRAESVKQNSNKLIKVFEILESFADQSKVFDQKLDAAISNAILSNSQTKASDEKLTKLIELFETNAQFIQKLEKELNISSQKVGENQASVILANEKLAKLIEIMKTMAVSQSRIDEVAVAQKQMVQSQDQIIAAQQQMSAAQNQINESQNNIKEALADLRRKANVNIARNDDIKKRQDKIEQALKVNRSNR